VLAALGTAFYMSRLFFLTFVGKPRTPAAEHAHESSPAMTVPLLVLATLAAVALVLALPLHGQLGMIFEHYMEPVFALGTAQLMRLGHFHAGAHEPWPYFVAWGTAAAGTFVAWALYVGPAVEAPAKLARALPGLYRFTYDKFRVDELYQVVVIEPLRLGAYVLWRIVDVFAIDGLLVNGVARVVGWVSSVVRLGQNGDVQRYAAVMAIAAAAILFSVLGVGGN
jgi:NADH-quinone oxidoreductase subunit L